MTCSRVLAWPLLVLLAPLACAPAGGTEPAPVSSPTSEPNQAIPPGSSSAPEPTAEVLVEPEPPAPVIADSDIHTGTWVEAGVQPGLATFAAELDTTNGAGSIWIGKLDGNGGRDVLIYVPRNADNKKPFELVFHFHGTYSESVAKPLPDMPKREWVGWDRLTQTVAAIDELQATRAHNVALIYPISAGKRLEPGHKGWSNVAYDRMWMDGVAPPSYSDDFARLHEESVALLVDTFGVHPSKLPETVIAEGHSAGGIALLNIAIHGSPHVREYIFLDASFQSWADGCHAAVKSSGATAKLTLVVTDKGIADPFEGRDPWCVDQEADAALWLERKSWCANQAKGPDTDVPGCDWTCAELEERAQEWKDDYEPWCTAMRANMQGVDGVLLIETKVVHGDHPRRFTGGLELPLDRWTVSGP
jgi:pimeloyl-ACP methyl ester carboxylesterase